LSASGDNKQPDKPTMCNDEDSKTTGSTPNAMPDAKMWEWPDLSDPRMLPQSTKWCVVKPKKITAPEVLKARRERAEQKAKRRQQIRDGDFEVSDDDIFVNPPKRAQVVTTRPNEGYPPSDDDW